MSDPRHPGTRLKWQWVLDYYHASEYISKLAEALFSESPKGASWARRMRRWLKEKPRGIYRVLHSAAALRRRRMVLGERRKQCRTAYAYLRKRIRAVDYHQYRRDHLPIGSGVTEAACKTVFTQRMKQSEMTWKTEGGQWIVDLRVVHLSGVRTRVYQAYLRSKATPAIRTQGIAGKNKTSKSRVIVGTGAIAPAQSADIALLLVVSELRPVASHWKPPSFVLGRGLSLCWEGSASPSPRTDQHTS